MEFVGELYNVKCLKLDTFRIVPYPTFSDLSHKFRNLTQLNLCDGLCFLTSFLENADSLRLLTIVGSYEVAKYWEEPKQVPACLISSLETVNLVELELSNESQFDVVRYILKNGKVLKRMKIATQVIPDYLLQYDSDKTKKKKKKEKFEVLKQLALFERGSNACQLACEIS